MGIQSQMLLHCVSIRGIVKGLLDFQRKQSIGSYLAGTISKYYPSTMFVKKKVMYINFKIMYQILIQHKCFKHAVWKG